MKYYDGAYQVGSGGFSRLVCFIKVKNPYQISIRLFRKVLITSICIAAAGGSQSVRAYSKHPQQLFSALLKQDVLRLQRALRCFESLESVATPCESN